MESYKLLKHVPIMHVFKLFQIEYLKSLIDNNKILLRHVYYYPTTHTPPWPLVHTSYPRGRATGKLRGTVAVIWCRAGVGASPYRELAHNHPHISFW